MPYRYTEDSGVRVTQCKSWDDFIQALRPAVGKENATRIYRGQADPSWKLSSTWERYIKRLKEERPDAMNRELFDDIGYENMRDFSLRIFMEHAVRMPNMPEFLLDGTESTIPDKWAFSRHYGLKTPYLDWSQSPFVAAFWAFADRVTSDNPHILDGIPQLKITTSDRPVAVWELSCASDLFIEGEFEVINNARFELHRQRAQDGLFTKLEHYKYVDIQEYLESREMGWHLDRYEIPCSSENDICIAISDLDRMNINYATLFPDPHGAAMQANAGMYWFRCKLLASKEEPSWDSPPPQEA